MARLSIILTAEKGKAITANKTLATARDVLKLLRAIEMARIPEKHKLVLWQVDILNSPNTTMLVFHADSTGVVSEGDYYETMAEATKKMREATP